MEDELRSPVVGRWMSFRVRLARPRAAWAALCGALASGALGLGGRQLLSLGLVLVLVEPVWGTLWELALGTDWSGGEDEPAPDGERTLGALPYTVPGSPGYRLARWLGQGWSRWQTTLWPRTGSAVAGLFVAATLAVALAIVLGRPVVAVSAAALVCAALAFLSTRGQARPWLWPRAVVEIGLAWLAGHLAFGPLTWPSAALAVLYTGVYLARLVFATSCEQHPRPGLSHALQAAVAVLLVALRRPVLAGAVGLLLTPQWSMQPLLDRGATRSGYLRRTEPLILAAMLAAAVAVG